MGAPRKPVALKVIQGTARKDRDSATMQLPAIKEIPPAPDWLPNAYAVAEWDRLTAILTANKVLTEGSLSILATLCATHGQVVDLFKKGEMPPGAILSALRNMNSDFGISPASQSKVRPAPPEEELNPFLRHGKKP